MNFTVAPNSIGCTCDTIKPSVIVKVDTTANTILVTDASTYTNLDSFVSGTVEIKDGKGNIVASGGFGTVLSLSKRTFFVSVLIKSLKGSATLSANFINVSSNTYTISQ